ncbi:MAG: glycosyltransferase family 4 protein [Acidobacteria bacterium]|nr:glycosyltransferase family 4 protein [Acidobacteriota bacterium]MBI3425544.1 glycosyltransferase family 4 protein [Acidobacteriota bacterium]
MHICFLCNEYPPGKHGGIGSFTQTLARALVARGHQVTVIGFYPPDRQGEENDQGVRVLRLAHAALPGSGFLANGLKLRQTLNQLHRAQPLDILEGPENGLALVPAQFPATKIIRMNGGHRFFAKTLGNPTSPWRSWLERRSFAHADQLCAVSKYVAETTRQLLQLKGQPIEILPNPVDVEMFQPRPNLAEVPGLILFAGTVCEKKGIRQLVQAMPRIVAAVPQARLWIAGRDWHDPQTGASYIEMLRQLIPPELTERIVFKGPIEHALLPELLAQVAVCVYPSHMEALPLAWLEGLAMGKAVVASNTGPGAEVIEDRVSGLLCNPHEPASIAAAVIEALKDAGLRQRLGEQARRRAVKHFSIDKLVAQNEAYYLRWAQNGATHS